MRSNLLPPSWRMGLPLAAVAGVLALLLSGHAQGDSPQAAFAAENDAAMRKMMAGMAIKPSGDIDRDFAAMMIPHHQGAIDMALAELRYGRNEQLRRIAQEIIVEQQQEIDAMHLALGSPPAGASVAAPPSSAAERAPAAPPRSSHAYPMH